MMTFNPPYINVTDSGGSFDISATLDNRPRDTQSWRLTVVTEGTGITATEKGSNVNYCDFTIKVPSSTYEYLPVSIKVDREISDGSFVNEGTFEFIINGGIIIPIWKDYLYEYPTQNNYVDYVILDEDGLEIFNGRAYKFPDKDRVYINLNEIVKNYLSSDINLSSNYSSAGRITNYIKQFSLNINTETIPFQFYNDWSYIDNSITDVRSLSDPINDKFDQRQYVFYSAIDFTGEGSLGIKYDDYTHSTSFNDPSALIYIIRPDADTDSVTFTFGDTEKTFYRCDRGYDYCLYYENSLGGWDFILVNGNTKKKDEFTSESYKKIADNSKDFSRTKFSTVITPNWTVYIGHLTDDQSLKMHNLIESNRIYLHNLKDDILIPVNITDTSYEYKTYQNSGYFYYTINLEASQDKYRE